MAIILISQVPVGPSLSFFEAPLPAKTEYRTSILPKPSHKLSLWTVMKNCIGKDLSKIPMPVSFLDPLMNGTWCDQVKGAMCGPRGLAITTIEIGHVVAERGAVS